MTLPLIANLLSTLHQETIPLLPDELLDSSAGEVNATDKPVIHFEHELGQAIFSGNPSNADFGEVEVEDVPQGKEVLPAASKLTQVNPFWIPTAGMPEPAIPNLNEPTMKSTGLIARDFSHLGEQSDLNPTSLKMAPRVPVTEQAFAARLWEQNPAVATSPQPLETLPAEPNKITDQNRLPLSNNVQEAMKKEDQVLNPDPEPYEVIHESGDQKSVRETLNTHMEPRSTGGRTLAPAAPVERSTSGAMVQQIESLLETTKPVISRQIGVRIDSAHLDQTQPAQTRPVDLYLEQRGRNLHVSVHTADPSLAGELRNSLSDLSARLNQQGFRTETWATPSEIIPVQSVLRSDSTEAQDQAFRDPEQHQGNSQRDSERRQQGNDEEAPRRPKWLTEFEKRLFAPEHNTRKDIHEYHSKSPTADLA